MKPENCGSECRVYGALDFCPCFEVVNGEVREFKSALERLQKYGKSPLEIATKEILELKAVRGMKNLIVCLFVIMLFGCVQEPAEVKTESSDEALEDGIYFVEEVEVEWSIQILHNEDGIKTVDVVFAEDVTPTEAARDFFEKVLQNELCGDEWLKCECDFKIESVEVTE